MMCQNPFARLKLAISFCTLLGFSLLCASPMLAVPVAPGDANVAMGGTTFAANPDLGGVVQSDPLRAFEIRDNLNNVILTGNLQDRVAKSDNTGTMIFGPRLRDLANPAGGPTAWITALQIVGYNGFTTDIDFRTDGLGDVGANDVSRSADGNELLFGYDPNIITPPDEALFLSVFTDATAFAPVGTATIFAQTDFGANVFSVTLEQINVPIPEPTTFVGLVVGLVGLGLTRRRW